MTTQKRIVNTLIFAAVLFAPGQLLAQKMRVGYWTSGFSLGFGAVMEQMKFAEQRGLNVEWVKFAEVNGPTRAIVSNAIDLAFAAPSTNSISIAADGVPVKLVLATQIAEAQVVVLENSPVRAIADLKGRKVGMSPPGSATHAIATAILPDVQGVGDFFGKIEPLYVVIFLYLVVYGAGPVSLDALVVRRLERIDAEDEAPADPHAAARVRAVRA